MFLRAESKSPEVGKIKDELFMPQEKLFFPRSDRCQPRSESCPAEADTCQTKERRASLKAWSESEIFSISGPFRFSPEDTFSLSIKPRPQSRSRISPDLEVHPFISYKPNYKCSIVSRSSTENSRPLGLLFSNHK